MRDLYSDISGFQSSILESDQRYDIAENVKTLISQSNSATFLLFKYCCVNAIFKDSTNFASDVFATAESYKDPSMLNTIIDKITNILTLDLYSLSVTEWNTLLSDCNDIYAYSNKAFSDYENYSSALKNLFNNLSLAKMDTSDKTYQSIYNLKDTINRSKIDEYRSALSTMKPQEFSAYFDTEKYNIRYEVLSI